MPQIVIEQPGLPPMTIPLMEKQITLGRSEENDVVLSADEVSRHHARIGRKGGRTILTDLKSLNGTYVNRQRVSERVLNHLDDIWLGSKCRLIYRDDTACDAPSQDPPTDSPRQEEGLEKSIDSIRAEMDQVGRNITLMGERARQPGATLLTEQETSLLSHEELVQMSRAYRRLAALHKAHQVIASDFDLKTRLTNTLQTIMAVLKAKRGFVLLRDAGTDVLRALVSLQMGEHLTASSPSMGIAGRAAIDGEPVLMRDRDSNSEFGGRNSVITNRITSAMSVPLKAKDTILGSIYVDTNAPDMHFNEEDLELFSSLASQTAMAIDNVQLHERVLESEKRRANLARFLPGALVEKIINESETLSLGGRKTQATTLFCDIRGSSKIAEQLDPQSLVSLLNEHFTAMTEIIFGFDGTLDKYIGDEIMAVFGAPIAMSDAPYHAVCAALEMQRKNEQLNAQRILENRPPLHFGIGIDSGEVVAGYIGSPRRMDFTVVGDRVNTAKRFCDMAGPGAIVVGEEAWQAIHDRVKGKSMGTLMLKGKERSVHAYEIIGMRA